MGAHQDGGMVYHSAFNDVEPTKLLMGCGVWPLRTEFPGPCPADAGAQDPIDEALENFKANIMFRNFKPEGPGDLLQIYLLLFIHQCIKGLDKCKNKADGQRALNSISGEAPAVPGDGNFPISVIYPEAKTPAEKKEFGKMLTQLRKETARRLADIVFPEVDGPGSKFWLCFGKRKFINKDL